MHKTIDTKTKIEYANDKNYRYGIKIHIPKTITTVLFIDNKRHEQFGIYLSVISPIIFVSLSYCLMKKL